MITHELRYMLSTYLTNISITTNPIYPIYIASVSSTLEFLLILVYYLLFI